MRFGTMHAAYEEARREDAEVAEQIEHLRETQRQLKAVIASLGTLLGGPSEALALAHSSTVDSSSAARNNEGDESASWTPTPNWQIARDLLEEVNRPMTVPEMIQVFVSRGYKVQADTLRVAMLRKEDVFRRGGYGLYGLTSWSDRSDETAQDYKKPEDSREVEIFAALARLQREHQQQEPAEASS